MSKHILEQVQIDLINIHRESDHQYNRVLHVIDHSSIFSSVFGLTSKQAAEHTDVFAQ
jgi:hypothetical protein